MGRADAEVPGRGTALHRVVVTQDLALGQFEIRGGRIIVETISLRPGHISAAFILAMIDRGR